MLRKANLQFIHIDKLTGYLKSINFFPLHRNNMRNYLQRTAPIKTPSITSAGVKITTEKKKKQY
jgi:hypothetical protein